MACSDCGAPVGEPCKSGCACRWCVEDKPANPKPKKDKKK